MRYLFLVYLISVLLIGFCDSARAINAHDVEAPYEDAPLRIVPILMPYSLSDEGVAGDAKFLPQVVRYIYADSIPDEPDETVNNSTVEGLDSDFDGVRDDIERYVVQRYRDPAQRSTLYELHHVYGLIIRSSSIDASLAERFVRAKNCVNQVFSSLKRRRVAQVEIMAKTLNTLDRSFAFLDRVNELDAHLARAALDDPRLRCQN